MPDLLLKGDRDQDTQETTVFGHREDIAIAVIWMMFIARSLSA